MKIRKKTFLILTVLYITIVIEVFSQSLKNFKVSLIKVDGRELRVAIADTLKKREQGLSGTEIIDLKRRSLDGMLFVFDNDSEKTFQAWYMRYDLMLLVLDKKGENDFTITQRIPLRIGTTAKVKGKWVLEIPLSKD